MAGLPPDPLVSYETGSAVAFIGARTWVLAAVDPHSPLVAVCWELVREGTVDEVVAEILREGLRAVPTFVALGRVGERLRCMVAGAATASFAPRDGGTEQVVAGTTVCAWNEYDVDLTSSVRLAASPVVGADDPVEAALRLPVAGGVVLGGALTIRLDPRALEAAAPEAPALAIPILVKPARIEPQPEPQPEPEPEPELEREPVSEPVSVSVPTGSIAPGPVAGGGFDHLFGLTGAPPEPGAVPPPEPTSEPEPTAELEPAAELDRIAEPEATPKPSVDTMHPLPSEGTGIIDSLPWSLPGQPDSSGVSSASVVSEVSVELPVRAASPAPVAVRAMPMGGGASSLESSLEPPAQLGLPGPAGPPGPRAPVEETTNRAALAAARHAAQGGPTVPAVRCAEGHLSEAWAGNCRVCGSPIPPQQPVQVRRPALGVLALSTGDTVTLDRDIVMGRAPAPPQGDPQDMPHVVQMVSRDNDISRSHVRIHLDGWVVLAVDLGSTNGTYVTLPGQQPVRLRPNDPLAIVPGTVVSLADDVGFRYEVPR
jgi:hypothetical protein